MAEASVFHYHHENWSQVQRRFEREAIALQVIKPELQLRKRDFLRYLYKGILTDIHHAVKHRLPIYHWRDIWCYRLAQYWGSYIGNRRTRYLSVLQRESYFYPTEEKGLARPG